MTLPTDTIYRRGKSCISPPPSGKREKKTCELKHQIHQEAVMKIPMNTHGKLHLLSPEFSEIELLCKLHEAAVQFIRKAKLAATIEHDDAKEEHLLNAQAVLLELRACSKRIQDKNSSKRIIRLLNLIIEKIVKSEEENSMSALLAADSLLADLPDLFPSTQPVDSNIKYSLRYTSVENIEHSLQEAI